MSSIVNLPMNHIVSPTLVSGVIIITYEEYCQIKKLRTNFKDDELLWTAYINKIVTRDEERKEQIKNMDLSSAHVMSEFGYTDDDSDQKILAYKYELFSCHSFLIGK